MNKGYLWGFELSACLSIKVKDIKVDKTEEYDLR